MKTSRISFTLPAFVACFGLQMCSFEAFARGGSVSGGADLKPESIAWFQTQGVDREVKICTDVAPGFGFSEDEVKGFVSEAFGKWSDYLERIRAKDGIASLPDIKKTCADVPNCRYGTRIATKFRMLSKCEGHEDLKVYFGSSNETVLRRKQKYVNPFSFAELLATVPVGGYPPLWSPGFIWIAPPESVDPSEKIPLWTNFGGKPLRTILLHEIGHVFGNEHIEGTIMSENIANRVSEDIQIARRTRGPEEYGYRWLSIDQSSFLVFSPGLRYRLEMNFPYAIYSTDDPAELARWNRKKLADTQDAYKRLTGKTLFGNSFSAKFLKPEVDKPNNFKNRESRAAKLYAFKLIVKDENGPELTLDFKPIAQIGGNSMGSAFNMGQQSTAHDSATVTGTILRTDGVKKLVIFLINDGGSKVSIVDPTMSDADGRSSVLLVGDKNLP